MKKANRICIVLLTLALTTTLPLLANNISIDGTVTITDQHPNPGDDYTHIKFDISWDNSWRTNDLNGDGITNWDAAWVFAKWKLHSGTEWKHCTLSTTDLDHTAPTGSTIDAASDGIGVFIYRDGVSSGSNNWDNAKLRWNYGTDIVADDATIDVKVFAIEMVNIPEGSFNLYSGESDDLNSNFNSGNTIDSEAETEVELGTITWSMESEWCGAQTSDGVTGGSADLCGGYPKGYGAIYCMKYEISQGQYADFLSLLTNAQDDNRYPNSNGSVRHTISGSYGSYTASVPNRACNYLSWADGLAYSDWAGLRPMTELEYEKICRGPETADTDYAWGDVTIHNSAYTISNDGTATATVDNSTTASNCSYGITDGGINGPIRCGIFADDGSDRQESGATYYGVMEMSGNLWEHCITVAEYCWNDVSWELTNAGSFDGGHGNGSIDEDGDADVTNWPSPEVTAGQTALGSGLRGGSLANTASDVRVSERSPSAGPYAGRNYHYGFRSVRTQ